MKIIGMDEGQLRRIFQRIKNMTNRQFYDEMDTIHTAAYELGQKHMIEAMMTHPRIYNPMIEQVKEKAAQIREEWEGIHEVEASEHLDKGA